MKPSAEDKIIQGLEGFADALEEGKDVTALYTCRKIVLNLEPTKYSPALVKETRAKLGMSQVLFAQFLGVSARTVQAWEQSLRTPEDIACRFMDEMRQNPTYWRERFVNLAKPRTRTEAL